MERCAATTASGRPCAIPASYGEFCHVHAKVKEVRPVPPVDFLIGLGDVMGADIDRWSNTRDIHWREADYYSRFMRRDVSDSNMFVTNSGSDTWNRGR